MTQMQRAAEAARVRLIQNAIECTNYVALGESLAQELSEKHKIPLADAKGVLAQVAVALVDELKGMRLRRFAAYCPDTDPSGLTQVEQALGLHREPSPPK